MSSVDKVISERHEKLDIQRFETTTDSNAQLQIWRMSNPQIEPVGTVAVVPGFARRMRHMTAPALFLANNGFTVYRCDLTHHVGLSDGSIEQFTFSRALDSIRTFINFTNGIHCERIGVVAASLSMRMAIRLAASSDEVAGIVGLLGVVDTQSTLARVFGEDYTLRTADDLLPFVEYEKKRIEGPPFWHDWLENGWVGLDGTIAELRQVECPIVNLCGSDDDWVKLADVKRVFGQGRNGHRVIVELPHAEHELSRSPVAAQMMLSEMTRRARVLFAGMDADAEVNCPSFDELAAQMVWERQVEKLHLGEIAGLEEAT